MIFITQRGELPIYAGFLLSTPKQPASGPTAAGSGALSVGDAAGAVDAIATVAPLVF